MSILLLWIVTGALFTLGLAGIVVPGLPGILLIFGGVLFYAWATDFTAISGLTVGLAGALSIFAAVTDYLGAAWGAKAGGGHTKSLLGTIVGSVVGAVLAGPPGLFIGALLGAMAGALWEGLSTTQAARAALFSIIGIIGATVVQLLLGIIIIVSFFVALWM